MTARASGVVCGLYLDDGSLPLTFDADADERPRCEAELVRTESPASTLYCPIHGDVVDARPSPALSGIVHLNYGDGKGEWVRLDEGTLPFGVPSDL